MKRFNEMTTDDLMALSDENVENLIQMEMARDNITPFQKPQPFPTKIPLEKTEVLYKIYGIYTKTRSEAERIAKNTVYSTNYAYRHGYNPCFSWVNPEPITAEIEEVFLYKKEDIEKNDTLLCQRKNYQDTYRELKNKYDSYKAKYQQYSQKIWEAVNQVRTYQLKIDFAQSKLEYYQSLVDPEIAEELFCEAYKNSPDIIKRILPSYNSDIVEETLSDELLEKEEKEERKEE